MKYKWYDGRPSDYAAFRREFGDYVIITHPDNEFVITELRAIEGPMAFTAQVLDQGRPATGRMMRYSWPDGYSLSPVKANGCAEHSMGAGEKYFPDQHKRGPAAARIDGVSSDIVEGIGWLGGTNHNHFDVTFERGAQVQPEPEPEPGPPPLDAWREISAKLDRVIELLEGLRGE